MARYKVAVVNLGYESYQVEREILEPVDAELVLAPNDCLKALNEDWILAAGLDVFEKEPLSQSHPLLKLSNVVLTGHVGWYSKDSVKELQTRAAHEVLRVFSGKTPICWVNRW